MHQVPPGSVTPTPWPYLRTSMQTLPVPRLCLCYFTILVDRAMAKNFKSVGGRGSAILRLFNDVRVGFIISPQPTALPKPDSRTNLYNGLGCMVPAHNNKQFEHIRLPLVGLRIEDFTFQFLQECAGRNSRPRFYPELMLYQNNLKNS